MTSPTNPDKKLIESISSVRDQLIELQITMTEIKADLKYHIRRTDAMEEVIKLQKEQFHSALKTTEQRMQPIEDTYKAIRLVAVWTFGITGLLGAIAGVLAFLK